MSLRTIVLNFDVDDFDISLAAYAVLLAQSHEAVIIGHCAAEVTPFVAGAHTALAAGRLYREMNEELTAQLRGHEETFRQLIPDQYRGGWSSQVTNPITSLTQLATRADLVILGRPTRNVSEAGPARRVDITSLILAAGRPVMALSPTQMDTVPDTILIGWKNTREARRAVADAMPLLAKASRTIVAAVAEEDDSDFAGVTEAMAWLVDHDVKAESVRRGHAMDAGTTLLALADEAGADLIVTGAYGHGRLRETIFGGVTRKLLGDTTTTRMFSS
jgi:nucleotide-binding universal stress UspA family protein